MSQRHTGRGTIFVLFLLLLVQPAARAQDLDLRRGENVELTADRIVYESLRRVYIAAGSVRVVQAGRRIDADWLVLNRNTGRGIAAGNVRVDDGSAVVEARFLEFDHRGQQGIALTGRLDLGEDDFRMAAGELIQRDEDRYEIEDASFTTCRCPDDADRLPWQINANEATVELGGYAMVTNTTVDILGIPSVWVPWLMFPVKNDRASGILLPEVGFGGNNGYELGIPLFWAARHNVNVIAIPRYLSKRGLKPELSIETVYGDRSETTLYGSYLRDQDPDTYLDEGVSRNVASRNRWAVAFDNDIHLPGGARIRSDILVVSDNDYVEDFSDFRNHRRDRFIESRLFGFAHFGPADSGAVSVGGLYVDPRLNPDFEDRDEFILQRAPEASLSWLPTPIPGAGGLRFEMDADYTHFLPFELAQDFYASTLDAPGYDPALDGGIIGNDLFLDVGVAAIPGHFTTAETREQFGAGDRVFQEGEPLADRGNRVVLHPRFSHPLRLFDSLDIYPEVGWQQTLYSTRAQSFAERGLLTARLDVSTQLMGEVELPGLPGGLHLVEPKFGWALVSHTDQRENPLFVPATRIPQAMLRQLSLDNVVLDTADRVESANIVTLGVGNRFYSLTGKAPELRAEFDVSLGYDFAGKGAGHFEQLVVDGRLLPKGGLAADFLFAYDIEDNSIAQGLFQVSLPISKVIPVRRGSYLRAGYRFRREVPLFFENFQQGERFSRFKENFDSIEQLTGTARLRLSERWAVGYNFNYSFERSVLLTNRGVIEYTSGCGCWALQVIAADHRIRGFQASANFTILGFGQSKTDPFSGGAFIGTQVY